MDSLKYITLHTKSLTTTPIIKFPVNEKENLHQKVKGILLQNCNAVERKNLLEKPLHLVVNDVMVDEYSHETNNIEKTLDKHNIKKSSELTVFAEHDPEDLYEHYHVLHFETPTSRDVDLFNKWASEHKKKGLHMDVWHSPKVGKFAEVKVRKNVMPVDSGLKVKAHEGSLKQAVFESKQSLNLNSFHSSFHDSKQIRWYCEQMAAKINNTPGLECHFINMGKSTYGNEIYALSVLKQNPSLNYRPKFLLMSGIHAREWVGISTNLYILSKCLDLDDHEFQTMLEFSEIHIIPILNIDGYDITWKPGKRFFRKNPNNVDVNRNFNSHFITPKNYSLSQDDYPGNRPESERESRCLTRMVQHYGDYLGCIDWHCYRKSFCFPYAYTKIRPASYDNLMECAKKTIAAIKSVNGTKYDCGEISQDIYTCNGTFLDFVFENNLCEFPYVNELNGKPGFLNPLSGFLTKPNQIVPIGKESFVGFKAFVTYTLTHSNKGYLNEFPKYIKSGYETDNLFRRKNLVPVGSPIYNRLGIRNRGNTCYLNSVIQCFASLKKLNSVLRTQSGKLGDDMNNHLSLALQAFWHSGMVDDSKRSFEMFLNDLFSNKNQKLFTKNRMGDASSLSLFLIDKLSTNQSVNKLFNGQLINFINTHENTEKFFHMSLPNNDKHLLNAMEKFFGLEHVNKNIDKYCAIKKSPEILMITIKLNPGERRNPMFIPTFVDLAPYSIDAFHQRQHHSDVFELNGVIHFHGESKDTGHYTASVKDNEGGWLNADDDRIKGIDDLSLINGFHCDNAHVLFYNKKGVSTVFY